MTSQTGLPRSSRDALIVTARLVYYVGMLTIPALALRPVAGVTLSDLLFGTGAALLGLSLARDPITPLAATVLPVAFLVLLGGLLAIARATSISGDLHVVGRLLFIVVVWPWQTRHLLRERNQWTLALTLFVVGAAASGLAGVLEATRSLTILGSATTIGNRAPGLTQHVNDQGGLLAVAVPLALGLLFGRSAQRRLVLAGFVATLACIGGSIYSGSISGMAGATLGALVLFLRVGIRTKALFVGATVLLGAVLIANSQTSGLSPIERFEQATGHGSLPGINDTFSTRLQTDSYAWEQIQQHPVVGRGLDSASGVTPVLHLQTHNFFLLAWFQGGLLTLIGLLGFLAAAWRRRGLRSDSLRSSLVASMVAALVFSLGAPVLFERYFWLAPVFLVALGKESVKVRHEGPTGALSARGMTAQRLQPASRKASSAPRGRKTF